MKKIIAIAIAAILILAMCIPAMAAEPAFLETAEDLYNDLDTSSNPTVQTTLDEEDGVEFVNFTVANNNDPWLTFSTPLDIGEANKYAAVKYRTTSAGVTSIDFYIAIDEPHALARGIITDGEWHYAYAEMDEGGASNKWTGNGTLARFDMMAGTDSNWSIDIAEIAFFASEADAKAYGEGTPEGRYVWNHTGDANTGDPWNDTMRIGHDLPMTGTVKFNTDVSFSKVNFPMIWATAHGNFTFEIISGGEVVFTETYETYNESNKSGDVADVTFDLGKTLPAGVYTFRFTVPEGNYAFFSYGEGQLSEEYIINERGHMMFGLYTADEGEGFIKLPQEPETQPGTEPGTEPETQPGTEPETNTQTGDVTVVMFAVIAMLAMGAAVVFAKKKAF